MSGIQYAADQGAKVINLSLGSTGGCVGNCLIKDKIQSINIEAKQRGENPPVFVVAAGNEDLDVNNSCPARHSLNFDNVITVGAVDKYDLPAEFSNYGQAVDVCAPGVYIRSCVPGNAYALKSGTSMATPHVSAAVAMLILRHPDYTPAQIKALLKSMTVDLNTAGWDGATGSGRIDFRMLNDSEYPRISPIAATGFVLKKCGYNPSVFTQATIDSSYGDIVIGAHISPKEATDKTVTYSSANDNVVKVENSRACATGAGTVTIMAYKDGLPSKQGNVTVNDYWLYHPAESFAGGTGSETSPYLIETPEQLTKIAYDIKYTDEDYFFKHFKLTSDIDLGTRMWDPMNLFHVSLDGDGHAIKNMTSKHIKSYDASYNFWTISNGFLNVASPTKISNLAIVNALVDDPNDSNSSYYCGILGGLIFDSEISNCYFQGTVTHGGGIAGGLNNTNVSDCYTQVSETSGGIADSMLGSTVKNCYSSGTLKNTGSGICTKMGNSGSGESLREASIINSFSTIDSTSEIGFVGNKNSGKIIDSYYHSGNTYGVKTDLNSSDTDLTARTISTFKNKSFYTTAGNWDSTSPWDFNTVWDIDSNYNNGLPFLPVFPKESLQFEAQQDLAVFMQR